LDFKVEEIETLLKVSICLNRSDDIFTLLKDYTQLTPHMTFSQVKLIERALLSQVSPITASIQRVMSLYKYGKHSDAIEAYLKSLFENLSLKCS
jgi:hypothetical protein